VIKLNYIIKGCVKLKRLFKLLIINIGILLIPGLTVNAANFKITGEVKDNIATYEIAYALDTEDPTETSFQFSVDKTTDSSLNYTLEKSSAVVGTCDDLTCSIITDTTLTEGTVLATLTITNESVEEKTAIFTINQIESTKTVSVLKATVTTTQAPKSDDATLSSILLSIGTMDQTFSKDISTYVVTGIKDTVNSVTITPNCDNNCMWNVTCPDGECTITNSRKVNLQTGVNKVAINVTSESGSSNKTYILNIYRGEIEANSAYLSNIKIKDSTISPVFDPMVNDYTAIVGLDVDKLDLEVVTEDPNANIQIKGNDNLKEGENTVTITVTSSDNKNKQVYTIIVTKEKIEDNEEEVVVEEEKNKPVVTKPVEKKKNNTILIIILSVAGLALIIIAYILIFKSRKKKKNKDNDKNNKNGGIKKDKEDLKELPKEKSTKEKIEDATKEIIIPNIDNEPKQDIDEALDDLMRTKRLEFGDLDF